MPDRIPAGGTAAVLSMQQALNLALDEVLAENPKTLVFGEDCGRLGGVFRVTDGLQARHGEQRVFDTPLAESGILGLAVGLAMAGFHPIPEIQFDGFAYPAANQIICQLARMNYRSRGTLPMPVTLRVPSFGGLRAPNTTGKALRRSSPTCPDSRWFRRRPRTRHTPCSGTLPPGRTRCLPGTEIPLLAQGRGGHRPG